uniref:BSD domain-containing protein n=1 Tax=Timema poppense TaxID=170557 RepID=A0A7R9GZN9_TIMPO|nr:unnamed protein product [Timema poppensis]
MTTSSEDVLLQIGQVRYKKGDGTLYVMNERLAWMVDHRDMVSISPEGKPKIQLQVVLHDGSASTFHFVNHEGVAAQLKDRDNVKELLQQLLQKFKREVNKELEEKNRLLSENPALLQLYRDLVITQVISPEEFWSQHATQYTQKQAAQKQEVGVSGAFLADIKPQTDGCNGLRYNLTADIIECIFKTYPAVRKKHLEYVPHKLSESEFWTKFFQSHYFHRDRINTGTKDLFTECAKLDDQELKRDINAGIDDPMVDIASFEDQTLDDGYGAGMDKTAISQSGNIVHQSMIKRFNQHSIMVLKACQQNNLSSLRIQEKISYEDLDAAASSSDPQTKNSHLNLSRVERYLHGPMPAASISALGELMPGGALMRGFQEETLAQLLHTLDLTLLHIKNVVLIHPNQPIFCKKFCSIHDRVLREHSPLSKHLTSHLNQLLNAAFHKFATWQQRRIQQSLSQGSQHVSAFYDDAIFRTVNDS